MRAQGHLLPGHITANDAVNWTASTLRVPVTSYFSR